MDFEDIVRVSNINNYYNFRDGLASLTKDYKVHSCICSGFNRCVGLKMASKDLLVSNGENIIYEFYKIWDKVDLNGEYEEHEFIIITEKK